MRTLQGLENTVDLVLAQRAQAGDPHALEAVFSTHAPFVQRVARALGVPDGELDDVVQDVFVIAFKRLASFQHGKLSTWLYRITANVVANRHRARRVRDAFLGFWKRQPPRREAPADEAFDRLETRRQIAEVLAHMSDKKREVFALYEIEGLSGDEIAERVGCSIDTVWTRLHYARRDFEALARKRGLR
ncbi:MAG: RNA polymerase sigma factor [Myxococcaceae bacterium]|nr:RNA polymerase sigma factor [Myxococcaceae bacterium]